MNFEDFLFSKSTTAVRWQPWLKKNILISLMQYSPRADAKSSGRQPQEGQGVKRAESFWVSMWWKPKHITLNLSAAGPLTDQEPHSAARACSHLCTALKWKKPSNYWLTVAGVSYRNKYYLACDREWLNTGTQSSWCEGHLQSHISHAAGTGPRQDSAHICRYQTCHSTHHHGSATFIYCCCPCLPGTATQPTCNSRSFKEAKIQWLRYDHST